MRTSDYQTAVSRFNKIAEEETAIVHESGASQLLAHGERTPRVYILFHGTTNSPAQWLEFGRNLFDLGHNVFIPRAPYHGLRSRKVSELAQLTPADLCAYAAEALAVGRGLGEELVLIGLSGGGTIAAWVAQNHPEIGLTLLGVPFFSLYGLPDSLSFQVMKLLRRLPDFTFIRPGELRRPWVYRGQSTHGVVAYLSLAADVLERARNGLAPSGKVIFLTTSSDRLANNGTTAQLAEMWRRSGADVVQFDFPRELAIPHNAADPAADPLKRQMFYQKMLALLGERNRSSPHLLSQS